MSILLISKERSVPIDIQDLRDHCWIDGSDQDAYLTQLATAAIEYIEDYTGRDFTSSVYDEFYPCFYSYLTLTKTGTVTSVKYYDEDGVEQTLATDQYDVLSSNNRTVITKKLNATYPETQSRPDAVTIRYTVLDEIKVQHRLRQCVNMLVKHWYESRDAVIIGTISSETPMGVQRLLDSLHAGGYQ